jgi:hypothetical protein
MARPAGVGSLSALSFLQHKEAVSAHITGLKLTFKEILIQD